MELKQLSILTTPYGRIGFDTDNGNIYAAPEVRDQMKFGMKGFGQTEEDAAADEKSGGWFKIGNVGDKLFGGESALSRLLGAGAGNLTNALNSGALNVHEIGSGNVYTYDPYGDNDQGGAKWPLVIGAAIAAVILVVMSGKKKKDD